MTEQQKRNNEFMKRVKEFAERTHRRPVDGETLTPIEEIFKD